MRGVPRAGSLIVRGERCVLRYGRDDDETPLRKWLQPEHEWQRWDGPYYPPMTDEDVNWYIGQVLTPSSEDEADSLPPHRVVVADPETDALLGTVSWSWESKETNWARVGIQLFDLQVRGRGVGREALSLWTTYLFATTNWARLDLATWSGNVAMCKAALAAGYVEEGRFRKARIVDGKFYDSVVYGVLREEWAER